MGFPTSSTALPHRLLTYPVDTIEDDSVGSTIPAFPCPKPTPVTDSPPILITTSDRLIDTSLPHQANWTTMTTSPRPLPNGLRPHTTMIHDMLPPQSIRLIGKTPVVTIMDKYDHPNEPIDHDPPTVSYPSPTEPNYYVPLIDPPTPSTLADSITHKLLDRIIRDTVTNDTPQHTAPPQNPPHTTKCATSNTRQHNDPTGPTSPNPNPPTQSDETTNQEHGNSNDDPANDSTDDHTDRNNDDEQPTKRTKTTNDQDDDTQEFSLRIPNERSVTDTVYQITAHLFHKLNHGETLQFVHSNNTTTCVSRAFGTDGQTPDRTK